MIINSCNDILSSSQSSLIIANNNYDADIVGQLSRLSITCSIPSLSSFSPVLDSDFNGIFDSENFKDWATFQKNQYKLIKILVENKIIHQVPIFNKTPTFYQSLTTMFDGFYLLPNQQLTISCQLGSDDFIYVSCSVIYQELN